MTDAHKAALAEGRSESRAVKAYLEAIESNRPKRGRKRTEESMTARLEVIENELQTVGPLKRVNLIQERINLTDELGSTSEVIDVSDLEAAFVKVAKTYSERKGLTYAAWRELGVTPSVLAQAGISRRS